MINTKNLNYEPSEEELLKYVTEETIFRFYCGDFKYGKRIKSVIREGDEDPSFVIYNNNGKHRFVDFGGKACQGNFVDLVKIKFNLNYYDALRKIDKDLGLNIFSGQFRIADDNLRKINSKKTIEDNKKPIKKSIDIIKRKWRDYDIEYWNSYNISLKTLEHFNVSPLYAYRINGFLFGADKYCYHYPVGSRDKIYQPYSDIFKYIGNTNKNSIQGFDKIDFNKEHLIITSSYKEVFTLYELGYNSIAPNSETTYVDKWIIDELKNYFKIYILFDWDEEGKKQTKEQSEFYDVLPIYVPEQTPEKDLSDLSRLKGLNFVKEILNDKIRI